MCGIIAVLTYHSLYVKFVYLFFISRKVREMAVAIREALLDLLTEQREENATAQN